MQIREQPGGVLPSGDRCPLHNRAGDRFDSAPNVSVCTRYLELTLDSVSFSCAGVGGSQEVEQRRSVHQKCSEF
jgi:hypothetical protein